jgi:hypothetical protein
MSSADLSAERVLLDPTSERSLTIREPVTRLDGLKGKTVGLLDISKPRGDLFLNRIQEKLEAQGAKIIRYKKPTFTKPAPANLRGEIATQCDAVIEALAD